jgi:taurine--2-oxoglutarate transaminase
MNRDEVLSKSFSHNFWTWSAQAHVDVIPVQKAEGVYFWDFNGKRYLDLNSMVMCVNIGHGNQKVINAIIDQAKELTFAGPHMATVPRAELGSLLSKIMPGRLDHFLYTLGGSDANENAIKLARAVTGKFKILTRYRSYHGATMGAIALTGDRRRLAWEPNTMPGVVHFLDPFIYRSNLFPGVDNISQGQYTQAYLANLEEIINYEGPSTIAAILIESVTGTNGIIIPPDGYLEGIRDLCNRYGILMIADEVMSGFGRTGKWFAVQHWNVEPDMITMAKGLTSGYAPLGAVAMKPEIAAHFNDKVFYGGLTYNGHPLGLAAAIANIKVMQDDDLINRSKAMGEPLSRLLNELKEKHCSVGDVRSIGLFGAIELVKNRVSKEPLSGFNQPLSPVMAQVKQAISEKGVFIYTHFNVLLIIPPLIISEDQLKEGFEVIDEALTLADQVYID